MFSLRAFEHGMVLVGLSVSVASGFRASRRTTIMASAKSLDSYQLVAALLRDVHERNVEVFNTRALRLTLEKVRRRLATEGMSFLTKTLPRLGKAFDKAIAGGTPLNARSLRFTSMADSELPRFLGEFFSRVLSPNGTILQCPCVSSVRVIRQICFGFYKLKLPYSDEQEQLVLQQFAKTEEEIKAIEPKLQETAATVRALESIDAPIPRRSSRSFVDIARIAKGLLSRLFRDFDPVNIIPRHGPGAVSTKEQLWEKYLWTNVDSRITDVYPYDAYFCASSGEVCDTYRSFDCVTEKSLPARVILVPKDSRGPRLISCEPVDHQWVQQGLGRAIVEYVERHPLTKWNVFFTDQAPNRRGAILGSSTGRYVTLDLKEASDRVSLELVHLLFPEHLKRCLDACRSSSTLLPTGEVMELRKHAPMGSALCFPVMALVIWSILTAVASDANARESILVYGDDVIVPTAEAVNAIEWLESFGLKINRDKSCLSGLFRESCGMDAFSGVDVTPVRFRTVWTHYRSQSSFLSWIAYANQLWDKKYYNAYWLIADSLLSLYGPVPSDDQLLAAPSLRYVPEHQRPQRTKTDRGLQKRLTLCLVPVTPKVRRTMPGWKMLLRYFTEHSPTVTVPFENDERVSHASVGDSPFSVLLYTRRNRSMLRLRWR